MVSANGADAPEIDGEKLTLVPENAAKIRDAIQSLRNQVPALRGLSVYDVNKFRNFARQPGAA